MKRTTTMCFLALTLASWFAFSNQIADAADDKADPSVNVASSDWPWWRGPNRDGIAAADQTPPRRWSATENIVWKSSVSGRGHGSPTVVGDQIFLATADEKQLVQSVLCFDRGTGELLWKTDVHQGGGFQKKTNKKATLASSTIACDGQQVYVNFLHNEAIYTTALTRQGEQVWQTKISKYIVHQGYGSSPAIFENLVIVSADNKSGGAIAALKRSSGELVWRHDRPEMPNYSSPAVLRANNRWQLVMTGCELVSSFDPISGKKLWEIQGATTECVTTTVTDGQLVFSSGGYPKNHVSAIRADGSGEIVWSNGVRVYVPSMLVNNGYLYAVTDAGVATCWKASSGEEIWKGRLGGTFTASPVLVNGHFYATNESGDTYVYKSDPTSFELVAKNKLGDEVMATPAICGGRIYMRVAMREDGQRQELLYCIGHQ